MHMHFFKPVQLSLDCDLTAVLIRTNSILNSNLVNAK